MIEVAASAVNRADLLQRMGVYPPPPGVTDTLGLECSGRVVALGEGVTRWSVGDEVCALLAGGGQAELAVAPEGQVMPVPPGVELSTAAALPEACATVWSNLVQIAGLQRGETVLIHGGASGVLAQHLDGGAADGAEAQHADVHVRCSLAVVGVRRRLSPTRRRRHPSARHCAYGRAASAELK